jgi:hypothetical protein
LQNRRDSAKWAFSAGMAEFAVRMGRYFKGFLKRLRVLYHFFVKIRLPMNDYALFDI